MILSAGTPAFFQSLILSTKENGAPLPCSDWKGALGPVVGAQAPLISKNWELFR